MQNSKLYSILANFSKYDLNRLKKYLASPYFNRNERALRLFELLCAGLTASNGVELTKESLWKELYGTEPYDDVRFRKQVSDLLKLVEGFLAQEEYERNGHQKSIYLLEAVGKRKLTKLVNSALRSAHALAQKDIFRTSKYYFYQYEVEKNFYELTQYDLKRSSVSNLESIVNHLDQFYIAEKLRFYCSMLSRQYEISHTYRAPLMQEIIAFLQRQNGELAPPIRIYFEVYRMLTDFDREEHYFNLKSSITQYIDRFPPEEANNIFTYALNYCTRKINKGEKGFLEEYFELYKDLLERGLLFDEGILDPIHFKNIVVVGLRLGKFEWTEKFIHEYKTYLPESSRENLVTFNLAQVYLYQKKYDEVIRLLQSVEYEDVYLNINSKVMLLAVYYELDELEPLFSLIESSRIYLSRHKEIAVTKRKSFLNLLKYVRKLARIQPGDRPALEKLKQEILEVRNIASLNWLLEKIEELQ